MKSRPPLFAIIAAATAFTGTLCGADITGTKPRESASLYPAHQDIGAVTIAANTVPAKQAINFFSSVVTASYVVIEVAVFPRPGSSFEVNPLAFKLKGASGWRTSPANPEEVAAAWRKQLPSLPGTAMHPADPRQQGIATSYSGFRPGPDPNDLLNNLRNLAIPRGRTDAPVAGYLYFPVLKERKKDPAELEYIPRDGKPVTLPLQR